MTTFYDDIKNTPVKASLFRSEYDHPARQPDHHNVADDCGTEFAGESAMR